MRTPRNNVLCLALLLAICSGCATKPQPRFHITINWYRPPTQSERQSATWLAYLMARAGYIREHENLYISVNGVSAPLFEEEVYARFLAARTYSNMKLRDKTLHDDYFDDLLRVGQAGFEPEYVWFYLHRPFWPESEEPGKLPAFEIWAKEHLADHNVVTHGSISITPN